MANTTYYQPLIFQGFQDINIGGENQDAYPKVNTYTDLPDATLNAGKINIVLTSTGVYMINRKEAGMWYSNGVTWTRLGNTPGYFASNTFSIYDSLDSTKQVVFNVSGISTGQTRTITMPDYNVNLGLIPSSSFTNKSVVFYSGTSLAEDNPNFNYDSSTRTLVVGSSATTGSLDLTGTLRLYDSNGTPLFRTALDINSLSNLRLGLGFTDINTTVSSFNFSSNNANIRSTFAGGILNIQSTGGNLASGGIVIGKSTAMTNTTGTHTILNPRGTFSPASGLGLLNIILIDPTYNQSGTATGTITAINYAPTITSVLGTHYFINATSGITKLGAEMQIGTTDYTLFTPAANGGLTITTSNGAANIAINPDGQLGLGTNSSDIINIGRTAVNTNINATTLTVTSTSIQPITVVGASASSSVRATFQNSSAFATDNSVALQLQTRNSATIYVNTGQITANLSDTTSGSENSQMDFQAYSAGTLSTKLRLSASTIQAFGTLILAGSGNAFNIHDSAGTPRQTFISSVANTLTFGGGYSTINMSSSLFSFNNSYSGSVSSGAAKNFIQIIPTINQTGTNTDTVRAIYYNPTITALLGTHYAFESTAGNMLVGGTGAYQLSDAGSGSAKSALSSPTTNVLLIGQNFTTLQTATGTTAVNWNSTTGTMFRTPGSTNITGITIGKAAQMTATSGDNLVLGINGTFSPTSGNANVNFLHLTPTINQTITATGTIRGVYYNPTTTSILGTHNAWESTSGNFLIGGSGNLTVGGNIDVASGVLITGSGRVTSRSIWPDLSTRSLGDTAAVWSKVYFSQIYVASAGATGRAGLTALVAGTITIANTTVTNNSIILMSPKGNTNAGLLDYTINPGVSFTIRSANPLDARTIGWVIIEQL